MGGGSEAAAGGGQQQQQQAADHADMTNVVPSQNNRFSPLTNDANGESEWTFNLLSCLRRQIHSQQLVGFHAQQQFQESSAASTTASEAASSSGGKDNLLYTDLLSSVDQLLRMVVWAAKLKATPL